MFVQRNTGDVFFLVDFVLLLKIRKSGFKFLRCKGDHFIMNIHEP
jgi:hypothetical protein